MAWRRGEEKANKSLPQYPTTKWRASLSFYWKIPLPSRTKRGSCLETKRKAIEWTLSHQRHVYCRCLGFVAAAAEIAAADVIERDTMAMTTTCPNS